MKKAELLAAVALYAILLTQGKPEAEIKDAISKDEKGYKPAEVDEIYGAIVEQSKNDTSDASDADISAEAKAVIESNNSVIESNNKLLAAIDQFVESASDLGQKISGHPVVKAEMSKVEIEADFDQSSEYLVAEGKSFRHPKDFSKVLSAGEKLEDFESEKLKSLFVQGLIVKA